MFRRAQIALILLVVIPIILRAQEGPDFGEASASVVSHTNFEFHFVGFQEGTMRAIFHFKWNGKQEIKVATGNPQKGSTFIPWSPTYYFLVKSEWKKYNSASFCGFGIQFQTLKPDRDYFMLIDLSSLEDYKRRAMAPVAEKMVVRLAADLGTHDTGLLVSDEIQLPLYAAQQTTR